jgi:hypothetical protein
VLFRKLLGRIVRIDGIVAIIMPSAAPWSPQELQNIVQRGLPRWLA